MIELTERLLADAGGWQAMKEARSLHEMGRVIEATWAAPTLSGRVRAGDTEYRTGLRILSKSNVENLCTCRDARQRGIVCSHALAVGLAVLKPRPVSSLAPVRQSTTEAGPCLAFADDGEPLELAVVFAPNLTATWEKNSVIVCLEAIAFGRRVLLSALDPHVPYRVTEHDRRLITQFVQANGGAVPGLLMLPRFMFLAMLGALSGHPRVTFGKSAPVVISGSSIPRPEGPTPDAHILTEGAESWILRGNTFTRLHPAEAAPSATETTINRTSEAPEFHLKLEGSLNHLTAEIESRTGDRRRTLGEPKHPAERLAIGRLVNAGFAMPGRDATFILKGESRVLAFFASELPRLQREWKVTIGARFEHVTRDIERIAPRFEVRSSGTNWFDLSVELATPSGERFSPSDLQRILQGGQRTVKLKNRKVAVFDTGMLDEFQNVLRDCDPSQQQPGLYRVGNRHAPYIAGFASEQGTAIPAPAAWQTLVRGTRETDQIAPIPLGALEDTLRGYQKHGVYWLNFLINNGFGGLLADEMGLGKTVQILALLRAVRKKAIVICPSSLVFNWQREAQRFAPDLVTNSIVGSERDKQLKASYADSDVLITSYALLRRDLDMYRNLDFEIAILDEAQHIKNPESQNAQAAGSLRTRHRLALTGTPVENSVRDLWSLMNFLMPGYLGTHEDFRDRYQRGIETDPGGAEHRRLIQRIRPFILRRTKSTVLAELPDKIEQVAYCELSTEQASCYSGLLAATKRQVTELSNEKNQGRARMVMLTALLRLRQACCDLRLLPGNESNAESISGKTEMLLELLSEAQDGQHRVLVFSQFVGMLALLKEGLNAAGIEFCYLDGQTKDRAAEVDRFQNGTIPVFLISLRAGGTGLNLTGADTVIHFDPWWNPAVEAQATDRAHRIGQRKVVSSYKLIARGTVEEKILELQNRKRSIIAATLESEQPLMEGLSMDDIRQLLD